jgi:general secretion pathway protein G
MNKNRLHKSHGFTLIELLIVISIILILIGMAAGNYRKTVIRANETVLKQDLVEMRKAIDNYTLDKQAAPQTLEELVPDYLRSIPKDPITQANDWVPAVESVVLSPDQAGTGITNVHSASDKVSPFEGTVYNTW